MEFRDELFRDMDSSDIESELNSDIIDELIADEITIISDISYATYKIIDYYNREVLFEINKYIYHFRPIDLWNGKTIKKQKTRVRVDIDYLNKFLTKKQIK